MALLAKNGALMRVALVCLLMAVAACAHAPKEQFDPFTLEIEAGRWGVMNAQGIAIVETLPASAHPLDESDLARRAALDRELRRSVQELARLKSWACRDEKLSRGACASEFAPSWTFRAPATAPSWAELQKRSDAVGAAVMPVWEELCEAARAKMPSAHDVSDDPCPME